MRPIHRLFFGLLAVLCVVALPVLAQGRTPTVADLIAASDDYDTLRRLLDVAPDVAALLDDPNVQITFFAPTDFAFNGLFSDSMLTVEWYLRRPAQTDELLRRHIVPTALDVTAQDDLACGSLGTMLPEHWLMLMPDDGDWSLNNRLLDAPAEPAANGLLIPLNSVLPRVRLYSAAGDHSPDGSGAESTDPRWDAPKQPQPADGDVQTVLAADGRFSRWLALLDADATTRAQLDSAGVYTLFIPTNAAFDAYLTDAGTDLESLSTARPAFASETVIPGYFTPDILTEDVLFNAPTFCSLAADDVVRTTHNNDETVIAGVTLTGDVLYADNAVIYVVDGVREPAFQG